MNEKHTPLGIGIPWLQDHDNKNSDKKNYWLRMIHLHLMLLKMNNK